MAQKYILTEELEKMRVGSTRVIWLTDPKKAGSVASLCTRLKNEGRGEWTVHKDYKSVAVSVTRKK